MSDDLDAIFSEVASEDAGEVQEQPDVGSEDVSDDVVEQTEEVDTVETETDEAQDADTETEETTGSEEVWNWEAVADQEVPIVVDGVTEMVPLSELRNGYMRQADYTRKTQGLSEAQRAAQWAQDVQDAFSRDPQGTLQAFAQAYGLQVGQPQNPIDDLDDDVRPWAERTMQAEGTMTAMEQRLQQLEVDRIKNEIREEVRSLQDRYEDFDAPSVLRMAAEENISLENAHLIMSARRAQQEKRSLTAAEKVAVEAADKVREESDAKRKAAKQNAASVSKKSFRSVDDISADEFNSIDELFGLIQAQSS